MGRSSFRRLSCCGSFAHVFSRLAAAGAAALERPPPLSRPALPLQSSLGHFYRPLCRPLPKILNLA